MSHNFIKLGSELLVDDKRVSPELCDYLGNKAAQMAIDANISLTNAIVKVANNNPGLSNTHITNICHFANNEYFRKVASARKEAGENLVFEYPLADPPEVVKQLNSAAHPKISFVQDVDFQEPPPDFHLTVNTLNLPKTQQVKKASVEPYSKENPLQELGDLRETLERVYTDAGAKLSSIQNHIDVVEEKLYRMFKQAMLSGIAASHVADLWEQHPDSYKGVEQELSKCAARLAKEEPMLYQEVQKTAHVLPRGIPDLTHPLFDTYDTLRTLRKEAKILSRTEKLASYDLEYATHALQEGLKMFNHKIQPKRLG